MLEVSNPAAVFWGLVHGVRSVVSLPQVCQVPESTKATQDVVELHLMGPVTFA